MCIVTINSELFQDVAQFVSLSFPRTESLEKHLRIAKKEKEWDGKRQKAILLQIAKGKKVQHHCHQLTLARVGSFHL